MQLTNSLRGHNFISKNFLFQFFDIGKWRVFFAASSNSFSHVPKAEPISPINAPHVSSIYNSNTVLSFKCNFIVGGEKIYRRYKDVAIGEMKWKKLFPHNLQT